MQLDQVCGGGSGTSGLWTLFLVGMCTLPVRLADWGQSYHAAFPLYSWPNWALGEAYMAVDVNQAPETARPSRPMGPYDQWIQSLGIPVHRGYFLEDLRTI